MEELTPSSQRFLASRCYSLGFYFCYRIYCYSFSYLFFLFHYNLLITELLFLFKILLFFLSVATDFLNPQCEHFVLVCIVIAFLSSNHVLIMVWHQCWSGMMLVSRGMQKTNWCWSSPSPNLSLLFAWGTTSEFVVGGHSPQQRIAITQTFEMLVLSLGSSLY